MCSDQNSINSALKSKLCDIPTIRYYRVMRMHELKLHTTIWPNLTPIMLHKSSQTHRIHTIWFSSYTKTIEELVSASGSQGVSRVAVLKGNSSNWEGTRGWLQACCTVLFLNLDIGYTNVFHLWKFIKVYTFHLCTFLYVYCVSIF